MMFTQRHDLVRSIALTLTLGVLAASCVVTVPASDSTPPEVKLFVGIAGGDLDEVPASGDEITLTHGENVVVMAVAADSEGVESVELNGEGKVTCEKTGDGIPEIKTSALTRMSGSEAPPGTGVGDSTFSALGATLSIDASFPAECPADFTLRSANIDFNASATNFHSGTGHSPTLTIHWR